jgi:hypothetical protein
VIEPLGEFPARLFRVFDEEKWARAFVEQGVLRLRPVQYFAALEDAVRADPSEGHAHLQIPGDVTSVHFSRVGQAVRTTSEPGFLNFSAEFVNPVFVCCFSRPPNDDVTLLPWKFGNFAVRIDDPLLLATDLTEALTRDGVLRATPVVECHRVMYNKGERLDREPDHFTRTRLSFTQKPRRFGDEYEWRLASIDGRVKGTRDLMAEFYDVAMRKRLPYAKLIRRLDG